MKVPQMSQYAIYTREFSATIKQIFLEFHRIYKKLQKCSMYVKKQTYITMVISVNK